MAGRGGKFGGRRAGEMRQFEIRGAAISLSQDGRTDADGRAKKRRGREGRTELEEKAVNKEVCRRGRSPRRVRGGGGELRGRNGANLSNLADFASDLNVLLKRQRDRVTLSKSGPV